MPEWLRCWVSCGPSATGTASPASGGCGRTSRPPRSSASWNASSSRADKIPRAMSDFEQALEHARGGGPQRHHEKSEQQGKLPVRERVERLVDPGSFVEDGLLANWEQEGFGADGVLTGMATVAGRPVC